MIHNLEKIFNTRNIYNFIRITFGIMWLDGAKWKIELIPDFGYTNQDGFYFWVTRATEYPVLNIFTLFVENIVLPNFFIFAWTVLLIELVLGFGFILGKKIKIFAVISIVHTINIIFSVVNSPNEWIWTYILMLLIPISFILIENSITKNDKTK